MRSVLHSLRLDRTILQHQYSIVRSFTSSAPICHLPHRGRQPTFPLYTLRPERFALAEQPLLDLTGKTLKSLHVHSSFPHLEDHNENRNDGRMRIYSNFSPKSAPDQPTGLRRWMFPEGTRGFLYYHKGATALGGQIRFRICDSATTFDEGRDLLVSDKRKWAIPLVKIVNDSRHYAAVALLREEGLVDDQTLIHAKGILPTFGSHHLYSLYDRFNLDLSIGPAFAIITPNNVVRYHAQTLGSDPRWRTRIHPYRGIIEAQFELSTLPQHVKYGRTLILKFHDVLEPIRCVQPDYDGYYVQPSAGTYFTRNNGDLWRMVLKGIRKDAFSRLPELQHLWPSSS